MEQILKLLQKINFYRLVPVIRKVSAALAGKTTMLEVLPSYYGPKVSSPACSTRKKMAREIKHRHLCRLYTGTQTEPNANDSSSTTS